MTREEKERLLAEIEKQYKWLMTKSPTIYMMDIAFDAIRKAVRDETSKAPEQEPKMGHWIKTPKAVMGEGYMWYCDRCEHQVYQDNSRPYPSENYCPNCGADMREVEE